MLGFPVLNKVSMPNRSSSIPWSLRAAALASMAALSACVPTLVAFQAPTQVRSNSLFEVVVAADCSFGDNGDAGCVLQIPSGFSVAGYQHDYSYAHTLTIDDPVLLSNYTSEPGHVLKSFVGTNQVTGTTSPAGGRVVLKVFLNAPASASGNFNLKVALVGGFAGSWTAQQPAGITQFSAITAAPFVRTVQVNPALATDFTLDANGLPFGRTPNFAFAGVFDDVDQDGDADLLARTTIAPGSTTTPQLWRANPGQAWTANSGALPSNPFNSRYAFGDFDADGQRDLAAADGKIFFGSGGAWQAGSTLTLGGSVNEVLVGDTNSDGFDDVLFIAGGSAMRLYRCDASRTFTQANNGLPTLNNGTAVRGLLADLTGDGNLDLYVARSTTPNLWVGDGAGNWTVGAGVPPQLREPIAGNIGGNAASELLLLGYEGDASAGVLVYRHQAGTTWAPLAGTGLPTTIRRLGGALIDFDGDGALDFASGLSADAGASGSGVPLVANGVEIWRNNGIGQFTLRTQSGLTSVGRVVSLLVGDFTGDGNPDLGAEFSNSKIVLYRNTRPGAVARIAHGCSNQTIQANGTGALGSSITTTLAGSTGVPVIGLGLTIAPLPVCSGCVLGHDWAVVTTGASYVLGIPSTPSLTGARVGLQGGDVFASTGCLGLPVSFSDTLVLTIQ